ncbi:hypothetical protein E2C01_061855 [Portunus trituberculatus]|uniref:Uncharacterized protein n=1 Tax=Portunus trituberculatus TaxID=210409 RepID=A0A5B7HCC8_PORTR|nr:hypothetical protein [Portunus trituberculatus]
MVPKVPGGFRLIINLYIFNTYIIITNFKIETVRTVMSAICQGFHKMVICSPLIVGFPDTGEDAKSGRHNCLLPLLPATPYKELDETSQTIVFSH